MLTNTNFNREHLDKELSRLEEKYQTYLSTDGRWLQGGFHSIVSVKPDLTETESFSIVVKREVFNMLPASIKEDLSKIINQKS